MVPRWVPAPRHLQALFLLSLGVAPSAFSQAVVPFAGAPQQPGANPAASNRLPQPGQASPPQPGAIVNPEYYLLTLQIGGPDGAATPMLINSTEAIIAAWLNYSSLNCQVVEAANVTQCFNGSPAPAPALASIYLAPSAGDAGFQAYLRQVWESANPAQAAQGDSSGGGSVQDTLDFKQLVGGVFDTTGRRRLSQAAASAPRGECVAVSVITLQMLYPDNNSADMQWNSTLDFFYSGRFLAKMQAQGFNLETAVLLGYQEPSDMAPSPSNPGGDSRVSSANSPQSGVVKENASALEFVLQVVGADAEVTNDTMLGALYSLVVTPFPMPGSIFLTPDNTAITDIKQGMPQSVNVALGRRRLLQLGRPGSGAWTRARKVLQMASTGAAPPVVPVNPGGDQFNVSEPSVQVKFRLQSVPAQATVAVKNAVSALVNQSILLRGFQQRGISVYQVTLQSFTFQPTPQSPPSPAPALPPPPITIPARKPSASPLTAIILAAVIPVTVMGLILGAVAWWWYLRHQRRLNQEYVKSNSSNSSKLKLQESSLFGSSGSDKFPLDTSAADIIKQMKPEKSSPSRLLDMPWSDWKIDPSELVVLTKPDGSEWLLGIGASGRVYKALRHGVQIVAVKMFKEEMTRGAINSLTSPHHAVQYRREISILKSCHDKNIVQFLGACLTEGQTILVTEYLENGDLYNAINSQQGGRYHWYRMALQDGKPVPNSGMARRVALDVARGLHFLHTKKIVHFDLKSANILLARDFTAKIADVGLARILHDDVLSTRREVGTFAWAAPEVLLGQRCTEAADIYSFGVLLHELSAGESPTGRQLRKLKVPEECPAEINDLIFRCLDPQPDHRPSARDLVAVLSCLPAVPPFPPPPKKSKEQQMHSRHNSFTRHSVSAVPHVPTIVELQSRECA